MSDHFKCKSCGLQVTYKSWGTKNRNHCPHCLASLHVDNEIGDRSNTCNGIMHAIGKLYKSDGEEVLVHKCQKCGYVRKNRVAGDDNEELCRKLPKLESLQL